MQELKKITAFRDIYTVTDPYFTDYLAILKRIKDGNSRETIERIRQSESKEDRDSLKKRLPSICWSGQFSQRDSKYYLDHSGIICLDIDEVKENDLLKIKEDVINDSYTLACFISPSGKGLKVLVKIARDKEEHKNQFLALETYFNKILYPYTSEKLNVRHDGKKIDEEQGEYLRVHIDPSGKDIARVCYESFDPEVYHNPDSELWYETEEEIRIERDVEDVDTVIELLQKWMDKNNAYYKGNRNEYIFRFASAMCRYGVSKEKANYYLSDKYSDFDSKELKNTLKSAYKSNSFGTEKFSEQQKKTRIVSEVKGLDDEKEVTAFWKQNDKGAVNIDTKLLLKFIEAQGFWIYRPQKGEGKYFFVRSQNMIVDIVDVIDIKKTVLDYVKRKAPEPVYDHLQMKNRYFENSFLNSLREIEIEQVRDTKDCCFFFFEGFYYSVTADTIKRHDGYLDLDGRHIWRSQLCRKNITDLGDSKKSDFRNFVFNATGQNNENFENAVAALGYGLHTFKKRRLAKMIYTCDAGMGELDGLAEGGTGKNLFLESISMARSVVNIDGKDFDKKDKFKFQSVSEDTQNVNVDDYEGNIKELFTKVTGHFEIEKKSIQKISVDFEKAPKLMVSSNTAPEGFSNSFARRIHLVEFTDYYKSNFTPSDEFGDKDFFSCDWSQSDWNSFYSFMFSCAQYYLKNGLKETTLKDNTKTKQLVKAVGREFADYYQHMDLTEWSNAKNMIETYIEVTGEHITPQKYYSKFRLMCSIYGWEFELAGSGYNKKMRIYKKG